MTDWQLVTIPARTPAPWEQIEYHLTDAEREQSAKYQARLEHHRNHHNKTGGLSG